MYILLVTGFIHINAEQDCNLGVRIFYQIEMLCFRTDVPWSWPDLLTHWVKILNHIAIRSWSERIKLIELCNLAYLIAFTRYGMGFEIISFFSSPRVIPYSYYLRLLLWHRKLMRILSSRCGFVDGMRFGFLLCASHTASIIFLTTLLF